MAVAEEAQAYGQEDIQVHKYAPSPNGHLEAFLRLDLQIYQNATQLIRPSLNPSPAESLVFSYLHDFKESGSYFSQLLRFNGAEKDRKLLGNPLVIYRAFWRFENYINKLLRLPDQDLGTVHPGTLLVVSAAP